MKINMDADEVESLRTEAHDGKMLKTSRDWNSELQGHLNINIKTELPSSSNNGVRNVEEKGQREPLLVNVHVKNEPGAELYTKSQPGNNSRLDIESPIKQEISKMSGYCSAATQVVYNSHCPTGSQQGVTAQIRHDVKPYAAYYNIPIKEEVIDILPGNLSIKNESIEDNAAEMIKMETGCTNSGCSSQKRCLHTYRCSKCNSIFTENDVFEAHFKKCSLNKAPAVPPIPHTACEPEFNQNLRKLIEKVKTNPCLYNPENEDYNDFQLEEVIWANIACDCGFQSGALAKAAWLKLKEDFHKALAHCHQANKHTQRCKYHKQMEFLLPYMSDILRDEEANSQPNADNIALAEVNFVNEDTTENDRSTILPLMSPAKKQKLMPSPSNTSGAMNANKRSREGRAQSRNQLKDAKARPSRSSHPLQMFFLSMCETTKNLPPHLQLEVKRRVFQAVIEAEETAATMNNNCTNNNLSHSSVPSAEDVYLPNMTAFVVDRLTPVIDNSSSSSQEY